MSNNADTRDVIEIDVFRIVGPIFSRWKVIALVVILALAGRAGTLFAAGPSYMADATLTLVKTRTDVQFDGRIRTSQPDDAATTLAEYRRNALVEMVQSPRVAVRAVQKFADRLPPNITPGRLLSSVSAVMATRSDFIRISVEMSDAKLAADIATFWAQEFEKEANAVLSGVTPEYVVQIDGELQRAITELDQVQNDYVAALRQSQADSLRLTINQKVREMDRLEALKLAPTLGSLQRKQSSLGAVAAIGETQERTRQLKTTAVMMRSSLKSGGAAAASSNVMALASLKMQIFTLVSSRSTAMAQLDLTTSSLDRSRANEQRSSVEQQTIGAIFPASVNYDLPPEAFIILSVEEQIQDIDALIASLTELDGQLTLDIQEAIMSQDAVIAPMPANLADIDAEITRVKEELRQSRAALEEETFLLTQLEQKRNTLRDTVQALRSKRAEVDVSNGVGNSYVRLVSEAIEPTESSSGRTRKLAIAGAAGLGVGVLIALALAIRAGDYRRRPQEA